jgi:hypothetical protein
MGPKSECEVEAEQELLSACTCSLDVGLRCSVDDSLVFGQQPLSKHDYPRTEALHVLFQQFANTCGRVS